MLAPTFNFSPLSVRAHSYKAGGIWARFKKKKKKNPVPLFFFFFFYLILWGTPLGFTQWQTTRGLYPLSVPFFFQGYETTRNHKSLCSRTSWRSNLEAAVSGNLHTARNKDQTINMDSYSKIRLPLGKITHKTRLIQITQALTASWEGPCLRKDTQPAGTELKLTKITGELWANRRVGSKLQCHDRLKKPWQKIVRRG